MVVLMRVGNARTRKMLVVLAEMRKEMLWALVILLLIPKAWPMATKALRLETTCSQLIKCRQGSIRLSVLALVQLIAMLSS